MTARERSVDAAVEANVTHVWVGASPRHSVRVMHLNDAGEVLSDVARQCSCVSQRNYVADHLRLTFGAAGFTMLEGPPPDPA